jgi:hypothetical protein
VPISSTNTNREGSMRQTSIRHRLLKNSSLSLAPLVLFSAPTEASYRSADGGLTHPHADRREQELCPLGVGSPRTLFELF